MSDSADSAGYSGYSDSGSADSGSAGFDSAGSGSSGSADSDCSCFLPTECSAAFQKFL